MFLSQSGAHQSGAHQSGAHQSGAHQSATCQKGVKSCQKGVLPKLSRDGGVYPRTSIPKRSTSSHTTPLLINLVHPLYTREKKKKNSGWLGGAQGERQTLQMFWSRFDGEHGRRRRRKALSPFLSMFWGVYLFLSNSLKRMSLQVDSACDADITLNVV